MNAAHKNDSTLGRKAMLVLGALSMVALVGGSVVEAGNHGRHRDHRSQKARSHVKKHRGDAHRPHRYEARQERRHDRRRHDVRRHDRVRHEARRHDVRRHDRRRHDVRRHDRHRRGHHHRGSWIDVTPRSRGFHVPAYISTHRAHDYRRYSRQHVWYAPHRHRHSVYLFPVWTARGWIERPHYYCGGHLIVDGHGYRADLHGRVHYQGRHVGISIGF